MIIAVDRAVNQQGKQTNEQTTTSKVVCHSILVDNDIIEMVDIRSHHTSVFYAPVICNHAINPTEESTMS